MSEAHDQPKPGYTSLLVHVDITPHVARRIEIAAHLAREMGARLVGLGAETFNSIPPADPYLGYGAADWLSLMDKQVTQDLKAAEDQFTHNAAAVETEWRTVRDYPAKAIAAMSRAADLIVASPKGPGAPGLAADPAEVVMTAGRPVLIIPRNAANLLRAHTIVVAWKDTREARRAVADSMAFLRRATSVIVQGVCEDDSFEALEYETEDVAAYLRRSGVRARSQVSACSPKGVTATLEAIAEANGADLIVAGAYGHSRMREWAFGGVTNSLINDPRCFVLLSH
jgi:nucleotide-binding universal stress UspA family protein